MGTLRGFVAHLPPGAHLPQTQVPWSAGGDTHRPGVFRESRGENIFLCVSATPWQNP
jgi:hypothetical protein